MEDVGAAVVAGCNTPPVLLSGKEILDFVTPAIQPLAVMDWFLAAATGCDARCPAGPASYGFCPCHTLDPPSPLPQAAVLEHPISTGEVTALPLTQVEPQGTTFAVTDPMELAGHAPLGATNQAGGSPLLRLDAVGWALRSVVSIIRTSGSARHRMLTTQKRSDQITLWVLTLGNIWTPPSNLRGLDWV